MNFVSLDFLYFLLIVLAVFYALPDRFRNYWLLAASYFFYGYWSVKYLCLLIFTMILDYVIALFIEKSTTDLKRKSYLILSLVCNLGILFIFKYFNFFSGIAAAISGRPFLTSDLILPFGISFYTFHAMSYVIDVYRREIPAEKNFVYYSGYVMFFPQLVAGPIARASHLLHQFSEPKRFKSDKWVEASWLIAKGYFMKAVIADNLAVVVDAYLRPSEVAVSPFLIAQAVYFFAFQIYCDFAGYTEIARGVAKLFDYELVVNFNRPYVATSITDFWRRWHISLSTWLRDYLYISLGGNRKGEWKTYRNLMLTMLLGGLWHGANLTFVVWGGLHGMFLSIEKFYLKIKTRSGIKWNIPRLACIFVTFQIVVMTWIPFRADTLGNAASTFRDFCLWLSHPWRSSLHEFQGKYWLLVVLLLTYEWAEAKFKLKQAYCNSSPFFRYAVIYGVILAIVLFCEANPKAFIYFQF